MAAPDMERTVSSRLVMPFVRALEALGLHDDLPELQEESLTLAGLSEPDGRLSHRGALSMLRRSRVRSGRRDIALLAAGAMEARELDIFEYAVRSQATVGQALLAMKRLLGLLHNGSRLDVERDPECITVRWTLEPTLEGEALMGEYAMALSVLSWRRFMGIEDLAITEVLFPHPRPPEVDPFHEFFRCPLRFDAPFLGLRLPAAVWEVPLPLADSVLAEMLDRHAAEMLERLPQPGMAHRVQELVAAGLARGESSAEAIARKLQMSTRTLHRHLKEESTNYRELTDHVRRRLALRYLYEKQLAISEVAFLLGFSNANAFHKAFKRWTGTTAGAYRQSGGNRL